MAASSWPGTQLDLKISQSVEEAETTCADPNHREECAVAWDVVEELFAARADLLYKQRFSPPRSKARKDLRPENPEHRDTSTRDE